MKIEFAEARNFITNDGYRVITFLTNDEAFERVRVAAPKKILAFARYRWQGKPLADWELAYLHKAALESYAEERRPGTVEKLGEGQG